MSLFDSIDGQYTGVTLSFAPRRRAVHTRKAKSVALDGLLKALFFVRSYFLRRDLFCNKEVEPGGTPPPFILRREVAEQVLPSIVREKQLGATSNRVCNLGQSPILKQSLSSRQR